MRSVYSSSATAPIQIRHPGLVPGSTVPGYLHRGTVHPSGPRHRAGVTGAVV
ncbi:hypothetical protein J2X47_002604 [Sphingomonas sp. BE270]|nr:hypothetical protein [Sphingomonas sp. BE137]MDR7258418.1 hypothetical protein [Sphingomonas sp. BE270]